MSSNGELIRVLFPAIAAAGALLLLSTSALAHCDTMDGPVVAAARAALEKGELTPALKWIKPEAEKELRAAFEKTLVVRAKGPEAKELADRWFFETLVRLHRAGEGAPFEGLKPAGAEVEPAVAAADQALETGKADRLVKELTEAVAKGLRERFAKALAARKHAGREYVAAYVEFVHYAERLHQDAGTAAHHHEAAAEGAHQEPAPKEAGGAEKHHH